MFTLNIVIYSTPRCPLKVRVVNITTKVPYVSTPFLGKKSSVVTVLSWQHVA